MLILYIIKIHQYYIMRKVTTDAGVVYQQNKNIFWSVAKYS